MSMTKVEREGVQAGVPRLISVTILVLVLAFVSLGVFTYYKWTVRVPTITPQEADIKALQQLIAQQPKNVGYVAALGYTYQRSGKFAEARQQYLKALKIEPKNMGCLYNLGLLAQGEKKFTEAENYYKKVLTVNAKHFLANVGLAEVYVDSGKYDLAVKKADELIKREPQLSNPHLLKAEALEKQGKKPQAKKEYQLVLQFIPNQPKATKAVERLK